MKFNFKNIGIYQLIANKISRHWNKIVSPTFRIKSNIGKVLFWLLGGFLVFLAMNKFLTFLLYYLSKFLLPSTRRREGFEGKKELLLLHMDGCYYCKKLMPEWTKFLGINDTSIQPRAVEKEEDRSLVKKYNVTGFPTILLLDENGAKLKTYEGERTASGLLNFCKQHD